MSDETPEVIQVPHGTVPKLSRVNLFLVPRANLYGGLTEQTAEAAGTVTNCTRLGEDGLGLLGLRCGDKNWRYGFL